MKSVLFGLLQGKSSRKADAMKRTKPYCADPLSHPDLQRMNNREIGDIYINPEKTLP